MRVPEAQVSGPAASLQQAWALLPPSVQVGGSPSFVHRRLANLNPWEREGGESSWGGVAPRPLPARHRPGSSALWPEGFAPRPLTLRGWSQAPLQKASVDLWWLVPTQAPDPLFSHLLSPGAQHGHQGHVRCPPHAGPAPPLTRRALHQAQARPADAQTVRHRKKHLPCPLLFPPPWYSSLNRVLPSCNIWPHPVPPSPPTEERPWRL